MYNASPLVSPLKSNVPLSRVAMKGAQYKPGKSVILYATF